MSQSDTPYSIRVGDPLSALDTPSMIVDLAAVASNIARMTADLLPTGVAIRPHLKTSKSPALASLLAAAGCRGGCVAKLSEAEVMVAAGFDDVFVTSEIAGPPKVARLAALARRAPRLRVVVDSVAGAAAMDAALGRAAVPHPLLVLLDLDVGQHRTGVQPGAPALALARHVAAMRHLRLVGVHGYEGHLQHVRGAAEREDRCREAMAVLAGTADALRREGHVIFVVTTGGTGTAAVCARCPGITEVQPGSFIFMDTGYRNALGARFATSLTVLSTVISKPEEKRAVIDAGLKSLTADSGFAEPLDLEGVRYRPEGDAHGSLTWTEGPGLEVGDRVRMVPSHIDPTINLHDFYYGYRDGIIQEIWPVAARGKV